MLHLRAYKFWLLGAISFGLAGCQTTGQYESAVKDRTSSAAALADLENGQSTPSLPARLPDPSLRDHDPRIQPVAYQQDDTPEIIQSTPENLPLPDAGLSLLQVIDLTLQSNPDIHSASAQIAIADATLMRARAEFYPTLDFSESYGVSNNPVQAFMFQLNQAQLNFNQDFNNPGTFDNFNTQLRVKHRLYAGGRRLAEEDAAQSHLAAASLRLGAVQNQLIYRVAEAYYRLLQTNELLQVRQQAVEQVEHHLQIVQARYRAETAVKSDVLTVEVRLAEVREALIRARNQAELAWSILETVTAVPLGRQPLPTEIPEAPWMGNAAEVEAAVAEALNRRPEVSQMSRLRSAAASNVEVARSGDRMTVDFVTDYNVFTGDFQHGNDSFFTGLVMKLNLFDGKRTTSDVRKACAQLRKLEARQRRLLLDIELEVRRSYLQLDDARQRLQVTSQAIQQAQESLREIEVRYRGQTATITQLIDAQMALSNVQVRQTNARAELEVARTALQRAIGRLTDLL